MDRVHKPCYSEESKSWKEEENTWNISNKIENCFLIVKIFMIWILSGYQ
jgi:hypothetical protein